MSTFNTPLSFLTIKNFFNCSAKKFSELWNLDSNTVNSYGFVNCNYSDIPRKMKIWQNYDHNLPTFFSDSIDTSSQQLIDYFDPNPIQFSIDEIDNNKFGRSYNVNFFWYINPQSGCYNENDSNSFMFASSSTVVQAGQKLGGTGTGTTSSFLNINSVTFPHTQTNMSEDTTYSIFCVVKQISDLNAKNLTSASLLQKNYLFGHPATPAVISLGGSVEQPDFCIDITATNTGEVAGYTGIIHCRIVDSTSNPTKVKTLSDVSSFQVPGKIRGGANGTATAYNPFYFTTADKFSDGQTAWAQIYNNNTWETLGAVTVSIGQTM